MITLGNSEMMIAHLLSKVLGIVLQSISLTRVLGFQHIEHPQRRRHKLAGAKVIRE